MPYGNLSTSGTLTPTASAVPGTPTISSIANGATLGTATVNVTVPSVSPNVNAMTVFYSVAALSAFDTTEMFAAATQNPNLYGSTTVTVPPAASTIAVPITSLAPGTLYYFRASASNG